MDWKKIDGSIDFFTLKLIFKGKTEIKVNVCSKLNEIEEIHTDNVQTQEIEKGKFNGEKIGKDEFTVEKIENCVEKLVENAKFGNEKIKNIETNESFEAKNVTKMVENAENNLPLKNRIINQMKYCLFYIFFFKFTFVKIINGITKSKTKIGSFLKMPIGYVTLWLNVLKDFKFFEPGERKKQLYKSDEQERSVKFINHAIQIRHQLKSVKS